MATEKNNALIIGYSTRVGTDISVQVSMLD